MIVEILAGIIFGLSCFLSGSLWAKTYFDKNAVEAVKFWNDRKRSDRSEYEGLKIALELAWQSNSDRDRLFFEACERIQDMLNQDDGEAFFEAEKFLKRERPDLYNKIGGGE